MRVRQSEGSDFLGAIMLADLDVPHHPTPPAGLGMVLADGAPERRRSDARAARERVGRAEWAFVMAQGSAFNANDKWAFAWSGRSSKWGSLMTTATTTTTVPAPRRQHEACA